MHVLNGWIHLVDHIVARPEEEIAGAQMLGSFLCPGNQRIGKSESLKVFNTKETFVKRFIFKLLKSLQRIHIYICLHTFSQTDLVLSLEQLESQLDWRVFHILLSSLLVSSVVSWNSELTGHILQTQLKVLHEVIYCLTWCKLLMCPVKRDSSLSPYVVSSSYLTHLACHSHINLPKTSLSSYLILWQIPASGSLYHLVKPNI